MVAAEMVNVLVPSPGDAIVAGAKAAVIPAGIPAALNVTIDRKLGRPAVVIVSDRDEPRGTTRGALACVKVTVGWVTTSEKLADLDTPPPVAVRVTVLVPMEAVGAAASRIDPEHVPGAPATMGTSAAVTPMGSPEIERLTAELNPSIAAVENPIEPVPPAGKVAVAARSDRVKLGTPMVTVVDRVTPPPTAFTVGV